MRICYIVEAMGAGVGRHVVDIALGMSARGHTVHVVYSPLRADPALLAELAVDARVVTSAIPMRREPHPSDALALARIAAYLSKNGPFDILHGHSSKGGLYARLLGLLGTAASIYTPHAFMTLSPGLSAAESRLYRTVEGVLGGMSSKVVCTSTQEKEHAQTLGIPARKLAVIRNGIDAKGFEPATDLRAELGLAPEKLLVGFVGRLEYQKGVDVLLRAARMALDSYPALHFAIIGSGSLEDDLKSRAFLMGLKDNVSWLGGRKARACFQSFDLLAMPSRYEGMPYTLLEALHCGVPVVCSDFGGVSDTIRDRVNGMIFPMEDAATFATRLVELAKDPALRAGLSASASNMSRHFTVERMCAELEALYYGRPVRKARITVVRDGSHPQASAVPAAGD